MPICDECKKDVPRRDTFRRGDIDRKVCQKCSEELSAKDFAILCDCIMRTIGSK